MASSTKSKPAQIVRYIGGADVREIDSAAWKNVQAEGQTKVVWNKDNDFTVDASELSPEALSFLASSGDFTVEPVPEAPADAKGE